MCPNGLFFRDVEDRVVVHVGYRLAGGLGLLLRAVGLLLKGYERFDGRFDVYGLLIDRIGFGVQYGCSGIRREEPIYSAAPDVYVFVRGIRHLSDGADGRRLRPSVLVFFDDPVMVVRSPSVSVIVPYGLA